MGCQGDGLGLACLKVRPKKCTGRKTAESSSLVKTDLWVRAPLVLRGCQAKGFRGWDSIGGTEGLTNAFSENPGTVF